MTSTHASERHGRTIVDAAAAWIIRSGDGPLVSADRAALDTWKAEAPEHAAAFTHAEAVWRLFDNPQRVPLLDAVRAEAYARGGSTPHAKD